MANNSVTKDTMDCYRVRGGHGGYEWATICVRGWQGGSNDGTPRECGEILIYSSFGSWAYQWGHLGTPFRQWLLGCEFDYVFTKFMGNGLDVFDGEGSVRELLRTILNERRLGWISSYEARAAWDEIELRRSQLDCGEHDYGYAMFDIGRALDDRHPMRDLFADPNAWPRCRRADHQAVGFWRDIWPVFIEHLRNELEAERLAPVAA